MGSMRAHARLGSRLVAHLSAAGNARQTGQMTWPISASNRLILLVAGEGFETPDLGIMIPLRMPNADHVAMRTAPATAQPAPSRQEMLPAALFLA